MIIWINGAFGAGKTETALQLNKLLPNSYVFDPENAGYYIRSNVPKEVSAGDFQDYPMWREFNYSMLKYITDTYSGTVIVPMTLVHASYFNEIVGKLRNDGVVVKHFALCASKETLLARLRSRGEAENGWAARQIDRCVAGLKNDLFQKHIDTEKMSMAETAHMIAASSMDIK